MSCTTPNNRQIARYGGITWYFLLQGLSEYTSKIQDERQLGTFREVMLYRVAPQGNFKPAMGWW